MSIIEAQVTTQELVASAPEPASILAIIARAASDPNCDVDKLERLLAIRDKEQNAQLEKEFNAAMTRAQAEMRPIARDLTNTSTHSKYVSPVTLDNALRPIYTNEGFGLSFNTTASDKPDHIKILCYVSHKRGFSRTYELDMPVDGKGAKGGDVMTKTHATGSGVAYGKRYLTLLIFNVVTGEFDDDGNGVVGPDPEAVKWMARIDEVKTIDLLRPLSGLIAQAGLDGKSAAMVRKRYSIRKKELAA